MARPKRWDYSTIAAADADGVCASQTPSGAGSLTINGALASGGVATMDVPRHVSITTAADETGRTFVVTGTDRHGRTISETFTGPNATIGKGSRNFATVTAVTIDGAASGAVTVGSADELETPWYAIDRFAGEAPFGIGADLDSTANFTWGAEITFDDVRNWDGTTDLDHTAHATVTSKTASFKGSQAFPVAGIRFAITAYVAGGAQFHVIPPR